MSAEERTPDELEALAYQHPGSQIQVHESSDTAFLQVAGRRYWAHVPREVEPLCRMRYQPPYDFAWCEAHDTTFALGDRCPRSPESAS